MRPDIENPITYRGWDELLLSHADYSFFHSSYWAKALREAYNYKPCYFAIRDGRLAALVPLMEIESRITGKRGVSLPFTDYCEPLFTDVLQMKRLFARLIEYGAGAGWKFIEIRGGAGFFQDQPASFYSYAHSLDLSGGGERAFLDFSSATRRNIRHAQKKGVYARLETSPFAMGEFYRLNCLTRKKHGLPPQPHGFFKSLFHNVIEKKAGFVSLAYFGKLAVSGAVFFHFGNKAVYKYGASDRAYDYLRGNNLLMWEAIKWFAQMGFKNLCFGRTEPENNGLRRYKKGWGASERLINYYRYDLRKRAFVRSPSKTAGFHNRIFRIMPVPLLKITGSLLYRHMG